MPVWRVTITAEYTVLVEDAPDSAAAEAPAMSEENPRWKNYDVREGREVRKVHGQDSMAS